MKIGPVALRRLGRLGLKLLLPLGFVAMIAFLLMSVMLFSAYHWQKADVINLQKELAAKAAITIEDYIEGVEAKVILSAQSLGLIGTDPAQQRLVLRRLLEQQLAISELRIIDENGQEKVKEMPRFLAASARELTNQAQAQKFIRPMQGEHYISPIYFARDEPYVTMAVPIRDAKEKVVGVLTAEVSLVFVWDVVSQPGFGQTGYAYAVDEQGQLIVSGRVLALQPQKGVEELAGVKAAMTGEQGVTEYVGLRGKQVIGAWHPIERTGWKVITELPTDEAYARLHSLLPLLVSQVLIGVAVAVVAWLYVSRRVVTPILKVQQGAQFIGDGHLDYRLEVKTGDELADVTHVFNSMTAQLQDLVGGLEQRVAERTSELQRRATQLQAAAEVSRAASSVLEPEALINQTVNSIRDRFDYYYVGLFLLDAAGRWAVLQAGTGEAGREMLAQVHKLEVGGDSMIGSCVADGQARIALDVGEEAVRFDNPLLPETRSEMALPLIAHGQVIGALTVQSEREAAFSEEDVSILQTMAAQVANAIQNTHLFEQTQAALAGTEALYNASQRITSASDLQEVVAAVTEGVPVPAINRAVLWAVERDAAGKVEAFVAQANWHRGEGTPPPPLGTRFSLEQLPATGLILSSEPVFVHDIDHDERFGPVTREVFQQQNARAVALLPLWVGARQFGTLMLVAEETYHFTEREIRLYRSLAGQIAISVESRRLLEESDRRAGELYILNRVADALSRSLDLQELLRAIPETVIAAMGFEAGLVAIQDEKTGRLSMASQQGLPEPLAYKLEQEGLENTLCELVFQSGKSLGVGDLRQEAPTEVGGLIELGLLACAGAPLMYKGRALGAICFFDRSVRDRTAADLSLLEAIGQEIGVAVENARLFEQTQRALAEAEAARQRSQAALAEVESVHRRYVQREWQTFLQSPLASQLRGFQDGPDGTAPISDTWLPDQGSVALMASTDGEDRERQRLAVPIRLRGQTIGTIDLSRDDDREWTKEDQALAESFAEQLALALENARLFEQTQTRARREQIIRQITDKIRGTTDLDAILQTTVKELGKALGTSRAAIRLGTEGELASPPGERQQTRDD